MEDIIIQTTGIRMRLVEKPDAKFIVELRTDEKLGQNLSETSSDIHKQITWIGQYKTREAEQKEFYFIIEDSKGKPWGTVRLYNIDEKTFTVGSWICLPGNKEKIAVKSWLLCLEFGYKKLNLETCLFDIRKKNKAVLYFAYLFHPTPINEDGLNYYFSLNKETFYQYKENVNKLLGL